MTIKPAILLFGTVVIVVASYVALHHPNSPATVQHASKSNPDEKQVTSSSTVTLTSSSDPGLTSATSAANDKPMKNSSNTVSGNDERSDNSVTSQSANDHPAVQDAVDRNHAVQSTESHNSTDPYLQQQVGPR